MSLVEVDLESMTKEKAEAFIREMREKELALLTFIPFSEDGIQYFWKHFKCTRCGQCCDGTILHEKGVVLSSGDFNKLKRHRKAKDLRRMLLKRDDGRLALKLPCPFYTANKKRTCRIYEDRPSICEIYPLDEPAPVGVEERRFITVDPYCPGACNLFKNVIPILQEHMKKVNKKAIL